MIALSEWRREAMRSLSNAQDRRTNPSPWPQGGEWRFALELFVLALAGLAIYALVWAVM